MITSIIHDVFLSNYSDKKRGHATLVDLDQINKWLYLSNLDLDDGIPYISNHREPLCSKMLDAKEKKDYIEEKYKIVHDILLLGNGKISLCGGSIIDILTKKRQPVDFDLFFHTGSIKEADDLLLKCMEYIDSLEDYDVEYWRSQGVQTVEIIGNKIYKIQFIRRVYETKDQILLGFDMAGCRIGYNPIDGFFATICGAMAFATGIFPLDLTQRSLSFGHRVDKYMIKGFTILLPGMDISMGRFITPDGVLYKIDDSQHYHFSKNNRTESSDYTGEANHLNWWFIKNEKYHNVVFYSNKLKDIYDFPTDVIRDNINVGHLLTDPSEMECLRPSAAYNFLGDKYEEFAIAFYAKRNGEEGDRIWREKCDYYVDKATDVVKIIKEHPWKFENPGSQSFGKFHPIIEDPREWYGKNYKPVVVGISMERLQAFYDCRKNIEFMAMPDEIFKMLCEYWFKAEVAAARQRLFSL